MPVLTAAVAAGRCDRLAALCWKASIIAALIHARSRKSGHKITISVVEGLRLGVEVVFIVRGLATRFFKKEVVERAWGL